MASQRSSQWCFRVLKPASSVHGPCEARTLISTPYSDGEGMNSVRSMDIVRSGESVKSVKIVGCVNGV